MKIPYFMKKMMVSCRCSLQSIHWCRFSERLLSSTYQCTPLSSWIPWFPAGSSQTPWDPWAKSSGSGPPLICCGCGSMSMSHPGANGSIFWSMDYLRDHRRFPQWILRFVHRQFTSVTSQEGSLRLHLTCWMVSKQLLLRKGSVKPASMVAVSNARTYMHAPYACWFLQSSSEPKERTNTLRESNMACWKMHHL